MAINPNYIFHPKTEENFCNHVEYEGFFSPPECKEIIEIGLKAESEDGSITQSKNVDDEIRKSRVGWIECLYENDWLWHKLSKLAIDANEEYYHFDLLGFKECIQFTIYDSQGSHYDWHMDYGPGRMSVRKLSIVVQLTSPDEYKGGDLQLLYASKPSIAGKGLGNAIVFPSYTMHRVTPIESGSRYSLVIWVSGHNSYR
jgi:PKHD-type hydroxylase